MSDIPLIVTCTEEERLVPLPSNITKRSSYRTRAQYLTTQYEIYQALLERAQCPIVQPTLALQHRLLMSNLNIERLSEDLQTVLVFDPSLHEQLSCVLEALFYPYGSDENLLSDRVRNRITFPLVLGDEGYGTVFGASLQGGSTMFTIKSTLNLPYEQMYEYLMGKLVINPLRRQTPNFVYTYAYHSCGSYFIDQEDKLTSWCITDKEQAGYLYREHIEGVTLTEWIHIYGGNNPMLVVILLQILNALMIAYDTSSFQHNDLSGEHILIRELSEPLSIPITVWETPAYVETYYLPQITNFGDATAEYDGVLLRPPTLESKHEMMFDIKYLLRYLTAQEPSSDLLKQCAFGEYHSWTEAADFIQNTYGVDASAFRATYPIVPFSLIRNSCRFYQRYIIDHLYHVSEYYDLLDLYYDGSVSEDLKQWVQERFDTQELDITPALEVISRELYRLMQQIHVGETIEDEGEMFDAVFKNITNFTTLLDYLYILQWYARAVIPLLGMEVDELNLLIEQARRYYAENIEDTLKEAYQLHDYLYINDLATNDLVPQYEKLMITVKFLPSKEEI